MEAQLPVPSATHADEDPELTATAYADLFPPLEGEEYEQLKADIHEHGQRDPIVLIQDRILDGRARYRACRELGIEPKTVAWDGVGEPWQFVVSRNLLRRHLTAGQRACLAAKYLPELKAQAKERQREHRGTAPGRPAETVPERMPEVTGEAREEAARLCETNSKYVTVAAQLKEEAPDLFKEVEAGKMTVPKAMKVLDQRTRSDGASASLSRKTTKPTPKKLAKPKAKRPQRAELIGHKMSGLVRSLTRVTAIPDEEIDDVWAFLGRGTMPWYISEIDRLLPRLQQMQEKLRELGPPGGEPSEESSDA
jgi:hypothetical protein